MRRISVAATAALLLASALSAQPDIAPGTRVRVTVRANVLPGGAGQRIGTVTSTSGDAFLVRVERSTDTLRLSYADLTRVEVSLGRKTRKLRGAIIGGLLTGSAFVSMACAFSNGSCDISKDVGGFLAYYAVGAIPGVIIGTAIGSRLHGPEQWRSVWAGPQSVTLRIGASFPAQ